MENLVFERERDPLREALDLLGQYAQVRSLLEDAGGARTKQLVEAIEMLEVEICNKINAIKEPVA